jgi:DNA-binding MarR family transcriptional regulator
MGRDALQPFELQVLVAALRLGEEAYSVPIVLELEKHAARRVSQAAVFIAVQRLEARGLVATRLDERGPDSGRPRRYVKVTPLARRLLRQTREQQARLWRGLDHLLDRG